jgi:anti-anti-sigma regulatory factor
MSEFIEIRAAELTAPVLAALRRRALENVNTLSPLRLPDVARRIVDGLVRFAVNGDALAAEDVGRQCATIGLALQSFFAAGRALSQTLSLQGATREESEARGLLVTDFICAAVFGIRAVAYETLSQQREKLEQALQEATKREHEGLRDVIRQLSTPVVPVADRVLLLPLVGAIDMERSSLIMERLLEAVVAHRAEVVLMDLTGVPSIEADVAARLFTIARSARLLGAQVIVVGLSPEFARSLVSLGVDAGEVVTLASVQRGLEMAARRRGAGRAAPQVR